METENFAGIDTHTTYLRALRAARAGFTIILLAAFALFWVHLSFVPKYVEMFDNTVSGGSPVMPKLTKMVFGSYEVVSGAGACLCLSALLYICFFARSVPRVVVAGTTATVILLVMSSLIHLALTQPIVTIVTKFHG